MRRSYIAHNLNFNQDYRPTPALEFSCHYFVLKTDTRPAVWHGKAGKRK